MMNIPSWDNPSTKNSGDRLAHGHLGGTTTEGDPDSWFPELWTWLIEKFDIENALDVGCGAGISQKFFHDSGLTTMGLDGYQTGLDCHKLKDVVPTPLVCHDLLLGPMLFFRPYDLVWTCEVGEHIAPDKVANFVETVALNCKKVLAFCAAPPGCGGYHHVNCQAPEYWRELLEQEGLTYSAEYTEIAHSLTGEGYGRGPRNYFARSGMIFLGREFEE